MAFEMTTSKDGTARLTAKVEIRLSAEEMARAITVTKGHDLNDEANCAKLVKKIVPNKTTAVNLSTAAIMTHGRENMWYKMDDIENGEEIMAVVRARIETLWA